VVELDQYTNEVAIEGMVVPSQVPFDHLVEVETVWFFTDEMEDENFAGRSFDQVEIRTRT
jgi:hypothetical protein